jgi:hypothetical protein
MQRLLEIIPYRTEYREGAFAYLWSTLSQLERGSVREWYGAFPDWGPLAEDSAAKLKRSQLNVCKV